jgi:hypothetical protein
LAPGGARLNIVPVALFRKLRFPLMCRFFDQDCCASASNTTLGIYAFFGTLVLPRATGRCAGVFIHLH